MAKFPVSFSQLSVVSGDFLGTTFRTRPKVSLRPLADILIADRLTVWSVLASQA